jgi:hypothetical protein
MGKKATERLITVNMTPVMLAKTLGVHETMWLKPQHLQITLPVEPEGYEPNTSLLQNDCITDKRTKLFLVNMVILFGNRICCTSLMRDVCYLIHDSNEWH